MTFQETLRHVCNCGTALKGNQKYCDRCRPIAYSKVKVKAQLRYLKETGKTAKYYRSVNPEYKAACNLREHVYRKADELQIGDIV